MSDSLPALLVDRREAARLLSCCPRTIDLMIRDGRLPAIRVGRSVRLAVDDLRAWIDSARSAPPPNNKKAPADTGA